MRKNKYELEDYWIAVYERYDSEHKDWLEAWCGCSFVKALWKYIQYHWKYPKYTVRFMHNKYY